MIPLIILGIFGNINVIIATTHQRNLHSHNTMLIAIIAVFDLAVNPCDPPLALVPRLSFAWTSTCTVLQLLILILNIVIVIKLFCNSKFGNLKNQGFHRNRQRMTLTLTLMTALYAVSMVTATLLIFITKNLPISPTLQDFKYRNCSKNKEIKQFYVTSTITVEDKNQNQSLPLSALSKKGNFRKPEEQKPQLTGFPEAKEEVNLYQTVAKSNKTHTAAKSMPSHCISAMSLLKLCRITLQKTTKKMAQIMRDD
ncbi:unnamed protein product [Gongylonema pulchrum]|uniref:G_PROTEIN_RECEP_F1_2 domain-containing protein n=1 Tax=Gongylonema pulchrum TaxID=637853 RepID=A0A183DRJ4_9BILA|nr:unnamed protein product [Gongylonema pulchrum]